MLFSYLWYKIPGNKATKAVVMLAIFTLIFLALMEYVYPVVSPIIYPNDPAV